MNTLKEQYHSNMSIEEANKMVLQTLKNVMEEGISKENVELTVIRSDTRKWEKVPPEAMEAILGSLA